MILLDTEITKKLHARTKTPNTPWLLHHSYENPSWLPRIDSSSEEGEKGFIEVFDFFCEKGIGTLQQLTKADLCFGVVVLTIAEVAQQTPPATSAAMQPARKKQ
jgi:hypothetical protein